MSENSSEAVEAERDVKPFPSMKRYSSTRPGFTLQIRAAEQTGKGEGAGAPQTANGPGWSPTHPPAGAPLNPHFVLWKHPQRGYEGHRRQIQARVQPSPAASFYNTSCAFWQARLHPAGIARPPEKWLSSPLWPDWSEMKLLEAQRTEPLKPLAQLFMGCGPQTLTPGPAPG